MSPTTGNEPLDKAIEALQDAASDLATSQAHLSMAQQRLARDEQDYAQALELVRQLAAPAPSKDSEGT